MKIGNIQTPHYQNVQNTIPKKAAPVDNQPRASVYPKYYSNNLYFGSSYKKQDAFVYIKGKGNSIGVFTEIPSINKNHSTLITLDNSIVKKYLSDKDGEIIPKNLNAYMNVFSSDLDENINKYKEEIKKCSDIIENEKKSSATPSHAQMLAEEILKFYQECTIDTHIQNAHETTQNVFSMCRTSNGYDFKNLDKKIELSAKMKDIEDNFTADFFKKIQATLNDEINKKGKLDLEETEEFLNLYTKIDYTCDPKNILRLIQKHAKENRGDLNKISNTLVSFSRTFSINNNSFKELFDLCFDPQSGKFNDRAAQNIKLYAARSNDWVNENWRYLTESAKDKYGKLEEEIACGYMEKYMDKTTGEFKSNSPDPYNFIETVMKYLQL